VVPIVDKWINLVRYGVLILLFLLIYLLVLLPIKRQIVATFQALPKQLGMAKGPREMPTGGAPGMPGKKAEDTSSLEASLQQLEDSPTETKQAVILKKTLLDKVKKEPVTASRLIQNWMRQESKS